MKKILLLAFIVGASPLGAQEDQSALLGAYQKEFVFLDNEIRLLESRKTEVARDGEGRVTKARTGLADLEARLLALTSESSRLAESLRIIEEEGQKAQDAYDLAQSIKTQGANRGADAGLPGFESTPEGKQSYALPGDKLLAELSYAFDVNLQVLAKASAVAQKPGTFFLPDGKQAQGTLLTIGRIAALGTTPDGQGGTLAPTGGGAFKLAKPENAPLAAALIAGETVGSLPLYLFQGFDKAVDTSIGKTLQDVLDAGGTVGYVIILIGLLGMIFAGVRGWTLHSLRPLNPEALKSLMDAVSRRDLGEAKNTAPLVGGALGRVLQGTIHGLMVSKKTVEDAISAAVLKEQGKIDLFRSVINVFAAVAPLLGLLGTVTGMISTFDIITLYGTGDPKLLSGGISEALVTTEFGLMAAIPLLLVGNVLSSWADGINSDLEVHALRVLNLYEEAKAEAS